MGSTFTTAFNEAKNNSSIFGTAKPLPVYLQFVPGIVGKVVTDLEVLGSGDKNTRRVNSILAKSHYGPSLKKKSLLSEENRYYPLFRGMVDVPTEGDQVLLCTIGGVQYYLGPVNTEGKPNFNVDPLESDELSDKFDRSRRVSGKDKLGLSENFVLKTDVARLQKPYNKKLDDPDGKHKIPETHGDMLFEGRHGNSIRIGSRSDKPYIIISNGRNPSNTVESYDDGSILALIQNGSIRQHFNVFSQWTLPSDSVETAERLMSSLISRVNGDADSNELVFENIDMKQVFMSSDRIAINSKTESVFISAFQHVHIGAGRSLTISTNKEVIIDSSNVFLGEQAAEEFKNNEGQNLILGENLRGLLEHLVDTLIASNGHCQGAPIPLGYQAGAPGTLATELGKIKGKLAKSVTPIVSTKHYIDSEGLVYKR